MLISSHNYMSWEKSVLTQLSGVPKVIEGPVSIRCEFTTGNRRKYDLSNKFESIADMLVRFEILPDDNYTIIKEVVLIYQGMIKDQPSVLITILPC